MILKRRQASLSLVEQAYWISEKSPESADRFLDAAAASFSFLESNPEIGRMYEARDTRLADIRVWRISGFEKHLIFYRPCPEGVEILDVIHGARDLEALVFGSLREEIQEASLSTWETVKNTGFLRKTVAENYGRRSQIAKNLGKSAILAC